MEKDRRVRVVAIAALIVGVVGLSLGFAALSNTLTIKSSAEVKVDDDILNVDFSKVSNEVQAGTVTPTLLPSNGPAEFTGQDATIDNSTAKAPEIRNLHATFTAPGQSVTYSFYTRNAGEIKAYLQSVTFGEVETGLTKKCTAKTGTTQSLVDSACSGISIKVTLDQEEFTGSTTTFTGNHDLEKNAYEAVTVVISYADGSAQADGDFDVAFGDITLGYSSVA